MSRNRRIDRSTKSVLAECVAGPEQLFLDVGRRLTASSDMAAIAALGTHAEPAERGQVWCFERRLEKKSKGDGPP